MKLHILPYQTRKYTRPKTPSLTFITENQPIDESSSSKITRNIYNRNQSWSTDPSHTLCDSCGLLDAPSSTRSCSDFDAIATVQSRDVRNPFYVPNEETKTEETEENFSNYSLSLRANPELLKKLMSDRKMIAELDDVASHRSTLCKSVSGSTFVTEITQELQVLTAENLAKCGLNCDTFQPRSATVLTSEQSSSDSSDGILKQIGAELQGIVLNNELSPQIIIQSPVKNHKDLGNDDSNIVQFGNDKNKAQMSGSFAKEGMVKNAYESSPVIDSFHNLKDNSNKVVISDRNLIIKSMEYNHSNWYNVYGPNAGVELVNRTGVYHDVIYDSEEKEELLVGSEGYDEREYIRNIVRKAVTDLHESHNDFDSHKSTIILSDVAIMNESVASEYNYLNGNEFEEKQSEYFGGSLSLSFAAEQPRYIGATIDYIDDFCYAADTEDCEDCNCYGFEGSYMEQVKKDYEDVTNREQLLFGLDLAKDMYSSDSGECL